MKRFPGFRTWMVAGCLIFLVPVCCTSQESVASPHAASGYSHTLFGGWTTGWSDALSGMDGSHVVPFKYEGGRTGGYEFGGGIASSLSDLLCIGIELKYRFEEQHFAPHRYSARGTVYELESTYRYSHLLVAPHILMFPDAGLSPVVGFEGGIRISGREETRIETGGEELSSPSSVPDVRDYVLSLYGGGMYAPGMEWRAGGYVVVPKISLLCRYGIVDAVRSYPVGGIDNGRVSEPNVLGLSLGIHLDIASRTTSED